MNHGFDKKLALHLARLTEAAYGQYQAFQEGSPWAPPEGYRLLKEIRYEAEPSNFFDKELEVLGRSLMAVFGRHDHGKKPTIPLGFFVEEKGKVFIIFRGTRTSAEWANNFNAKLIRDPSEDGSMVHEGFLKLYTQIRRELLDAVGGLPKRSRIAVAGHSLGSAFACFFAKDLEESTGRRVRALYTFGSPRLGDKVFAAAFNARFEGRSFRVVNSSDLVPELPFPVPFAAFGGYFTHVDRPVVFTTQLDDVEKNHGVVTYREGIAGMRGSLWDRLFGRPAN